MISGEKIRLDVHNILYEIYISNKTLKDPNIIKVINSNSQKDISFINNVTLNSMRYFFHTSKIIDKYSKKKIKDHEQILLISAITQIVFLNFKEYAVINCSVEIAKKLKIYHGFINALLKNINKNKIKLKKTKIEFENLPSWFTKRTKLLTDSEKKVFLNNYFREPSLHIVFKNKEKLSCFEYNLYKTSELSGFVDSKVDFNNLESFKKGDWWVQDFSSFFPLNNLPKKIKVGKIIDACSAPGGKAFQLLSKKLNVILNDKSNNRIKILKSNLRRLSFNPVILNRDFTRLNSKEKYDFIIIDAPCSAIGTIRKNPEIFFKKAPPNFSTLNKIQEMLLNTASEILNKNGFIIYMVCSFLKNETQDQIEKFLNNKSEFKLYKFDLTKSNRKYSKFIKQNIMITLPDKISKYNIDGYFAVYLKKTK